MERDNFYLIHILEEIKNIEHFTLRMKLSGFLTDIKTAKAVERSLEIIGEASKRLSPQLKAKLDDIPWREISGIRDKITHDYCDIDRGIVWSVLKNDLPQLRSAIEKHLKK